MLLVTQFPGASMPFDFSKSGVALERIQNVLDLVPSAAGLADAKTRKIVFINSHFEKLLGYERDELLEHRQRLKGIEAGLNEWLTLADEGHVYWTERGGKRTVIVTLRSAPLDVAPELRRHLFGCGTSVVCTSATLAVGGQIEPFANRIGAESARTAIAPSPFDFERNMRVYVATDVPLPSPQEARLALDVLTDYIRFCTLRVRGGSLVLAGIYFALATLAYPLILRIVMDFLNYQGLYPFETEIILVSKICQKA